MRSLQTGTINAAKALHLDSKIGRLDEGLQADIIAISGRPDVNIEDVQNVDFVMRSGIIYKKN